MIKTGFLILWAVLLIGLNIQSQNLVQNSSFEAHTSSPNNISELNKALNWNSPNSGTPDYFCACNDHKAHLVCVPQNAFSYLNTHSGNCYAGMILYQKSRKVYREYIQVALQKPLLKGQSYHLRFYISEAKYAKYRNKNIGYLFSTEKIEQSSDLVIKSKQYGIITIDATINKTDWMELNVDYTATGNERFLIIGKFEGDKNVKQKKQLIPPKDLDIPNYYADVAYYFIDDVSLEENKLSEKETIAVTSDTIQQISAFKPVIAQSVVLNNVYFETNKSELLPSSYNELNTLVAYLKQNLSYTIELSGYTDNTGQETDNLKLSKARAQAVADYLIKAGVAQSRIAYKGYGSLHPIKPNDTEEHKLQNRRVEMIIQ